MKLRIFGKAPTNLPVTGKRRGLEVYRQIQKMNVYTLNWHLLTFQLENRDLARIWFLF